MIKVQQTLLSFLENSQKEVMLSDYECNKLLELSSSLKMSGILLSSIDFKFHKDMKTILENQHERLISQQMIQVFDVSRISQALRNNGIEHVFMKGTAINTLIKKSKSERFFGDIDILVDKSDIEKAYLILRDNKFKYLEKYALNKCSYLYDANHLPPMINDNYTVVELHHRVTREEFFSECPLKEKFLKSKKEKDIIFIPNEELMISHCFYHGYIQNEKNISPLMYYDLKLFFESFENSFQKARDTVTKLGLLHEYDNMLSFFNHAKYHNTKNKEFKILKKNIVNSINMQKKDLVPKNSLFNNKNNVLLNIFKLIKNKLENVRFKYQVSFWSPSFPLFLTYDLSKNWKNFFR